MAPSRKTRAKPRSRRSRGWIPPSDDQARAAVHELIALVDGQLPQRFYRGESTWRVLGAAMIVRMADTMRSIVALAGTDVGSDWMILLRALYEQVVIYCWIAVDPDGHLDRWREDSEYQQVRLHNDAARFGAKVLTKKEFARTESAKKLPSIPELAEAVDDYWSQRIAGFRPTQKDPNDILNFRGLYVAIYRITSRHAHAQPHALDPYFSVEGTRRVIRRGPIRSNHYWSLIVPLYAQALLVCHEQLKWPDPARVKAINNGMYPKRR